jgi:hypothetical protein
MKPSLVAAILVATVLLAFGLGATAALAFEINDVSVAPLAASNLCPALGGIGAPPQIEIRHSAVAGVEIQIHMEDRVSGAPLVNHGSATVSSSAGGTTVASPHFLSPCNRTHRLTSNYVIVVSAGGQSIERPFGSYDSARGAIVGAAAKPTADAPVVASSCPPGKIACAAWCRKYRTDSASYNVCMYTHPTGSCRVLGGSYCARDRWHS